MRGMVFTEFLDFVEGATSADFVEDMLDNVALPSGGAYSAVGNYGHGEILSMVTYVAQETGHPIATLVHQFGERLFERFVELYPGFFVDEKQALDFLEHIEDHIHTEVRKLYPDARPPVFETTRKSKTELVMHYRSTRPFADLCAGLIGGAMKHFGEGASVERVDNTTDGTDSLFTIRTK
ncbi:MAG: heme NO-binding domain-containing protein [Pikeienuella sp.]